MGFQALGHELWTVIAKCHDCYLRWSLVIVEFLGLGSLDFEVLPLDFLLFYDCHITIVLFTIAHELPFSRLSHFFVVLIIISNNQPLLDLGYILEVLIMVVPNLPLDGPSDLVVVLVVVLPVYSGHESSLTRCHKF